MIDDSIFTDLFIFDIANNHQGSIEHAKKIILAISDISKKKGCRGAIKFQYRQLDTFIHPAYRSAKEPKHIPRFLQTQLSRDEFKILVEEVRKTGMVTICTPFDEGSVDLIEEHKIEIIKVASSSAQDWPLLERIAQAKKPVICSTGGCSIEEIDNIVSFFKHHKICLAIMHCVALYPTEEDDFQLNKIDILKERYPFLTIGFSSHERPDNILAVQIALAKGVRLFERHVGLETDQIKLNAYSSSPRQIAEWLDAMLRAKKICGADVLEGPKQEEIVSLNSLRRGVYAKADIKKGELISSQKVFFAMPLQPNQVHSGEFANKFSGEFIAMRDYKAGDSVLADEQIQHNVKRKIYKVIHEARSMLYKARIVLGEHFQIELSHHYGAEHFDKIGAIIINCVNHEYCKKLIIQMAGQRHPAHFHKLKEETFQVLWGRLIVNLEGKNIELHPGDEVLIKRGQNHSFETKTGVIAEEISTTHYRNDSFYDDKKICADPGLRKTIFDRSQQDAFEQYEFL